MPKARREQVGSEPSQGLRLLGNRAGSFVSGTRGKLLRYRLDLVGNPERHTSLRNIEKAEQERETGREKCPGMYVRRWVPMEEPGTALYVRNSCPLCPSDPSRSFDLSHMVSTLWTSVFYVKRMQLVDVDEANSPSWE